MPFARYGLILGLLLLASCDRTSPVEPPVTVLAVAPGCDVRQGCRAGDDSISIDVQFDAAPIALHAFPLSLHVSGDEPVQSVTVSFSMQGMDMGLNRYRLIGNATRGWKADVTLPVCVSGRSDWVADFELLTEQRQLRFRLPFVLQ